MLPATGWDGPQRPLPVVWGFKLSRRRALVLAPRDPKGCSTGTTQDDRRRYTFESVVRPHPRVWNTTIGSEITKRYDFAGLRSVRYDLGRRYIQSSQISPRTAQNGKTRPLTSESRRQQHRNLESRTSERYRLTPFAAIMEKRRWRE